jgi:hypothetical protein
MQWEGNSCRDLQFLRFCRAIAPVNSKSRLGRFVAALCALAICSAMAVGWSGGFICTCHGEAQWTEQGHCEGIDEGDHGTGGERQYHTPQGGEVKGRFASIQKQAVAAPILIEILPVFDFAMLEERTAGKGVANWAGASPPVPLFAIHSVVLRI